MRLTISIFVLFAMILTVPQASMAGDRVPPSEVFLNPDGSGDFANIQAAIDAVADGGTIYLSNGIYDGLGNTNLVFPGRGINLTSLSGIAESCIIDCGGSGFTPPPSKARGERGATREVQWRAYIIVDLSEGPEISHMTVRNGLADQGGAAYLRNASASFVDLLFTNNRSTLEGGGIYTENSNLNIKVCVFQHNSSDSYGGAVQVNGSDGSTSVSGSDFSWNSSEISGGAVDVFDGGNLMSIGSRYFQNTTNGHGGGIAHWDLGTSEIISSTFVENSAYNGAGIFGGTSSTLIMENIIVANSLEGGAIRFEFLAREPSYSIICSNLHGNVNGDWGWPLDDLLGLDGNINQDPQFCGEIGNGNLFLQSDSPCAAANNSCGVDMGAYPVNCDETVAAETSWSQLKRVY